MYVFAILKPNKVKYMHKIELGFHFFLYLKNENRGN